MTPAAAGAGAGTLAGAYSATGGAWQAGPGRIYDRLAEVLVGCCPGGVWGRLVADLGAGTGAAGRAALAAGARAVVAVDVAPGMLAHDVARRPPAVVGDLRRLPLRSGAAGAALAAFSLNHLVDPAAGLVEAARVLAPGGGLAVSAYATDDDHPVKAAVEGACRRRDWVPPAWYEAMRRRAVPHLATTERAAAVAADAGLERVAVGHRRVEFPELSPAELVGWRLGMAPTAPFVARLEPGARAGLIAEALDRLGPAPPVLVRSFITIAWAKPH